MEEMAAQAVIGRDEEWIPRIAVGGVGGAGCNTINRLVKKGGVKGGRLIAFNTDKKHLSIVSDKATRVLLGPSITKGLGAGGFAEIGEKAAHASYNDVTMVLEGTNLLFLAAGMGGGTGTGATPVIAEMAKKMGAIVISMVTYPFMLERARLEKAKRGIERLRAASDAVAVIDNNKLVEFVPNLPVEKAFELADEIITLAVRGISETILMPSLINIDFADVKAVMENGGISMIAVGEASGFERVEKVVQNTLNNRLLDVDYRDARGVLLHITGGPDMTLGEANKIGELLTENVRENANVVWGARLEPGFEGRIQVIAIFTGVKAPEAVGGR